MENETVEQIDSFVITTRLKIFSDFKSCTNWFIIIIIVTAKKPAAKKAAKKPAAKIGRQCDWPRDSEAFPWFANFFQTFLTWL